MISPIMRVGGGFDFMGARLGADDEVHGIAIEPPFQAQQPIMVYLPTDMPEPQDRNRYQQFVERGIIELAAALDGRLLVVFTSFTQLRQATQNMAARLALGNIAVFDQSDGTSRQALLDGFASTPRSVLLGTHTLWEDVETPFRDLSAMIVVRLPFAVPTDPIVAARGETFKSSFDEFTIPDAVLRFRQTINQMLTARGERSIIAILDRRLTSKQYGQIFLDSLPPNTTQRATMSEIAIAAPSDSLSL
jgi:DNA polymerase-3 subunit epsilon/ATP-dependent DNA helicase DinG